MKKLLTLTFLLCTFSFATGSALGQSVSDQLSVQMQIRMTTGERGRDNSSTTKLITISGDTIVYKVTHGGRNRGRLPEQNKEFKLDGPDETRLLELAKVLDPFTAESIDRDVQVKGTSYYFTLSVSQQLNGNKGTLTIKGARKATDIAQLKQYKDAVALIEAVYAIMYRTDKEVDYEPLIRIRIKPG